MVERVQGYRAKGGPIFDTEQEAKDWEFNAHFLAWWNSCEFQQPSDVLRAILDEKMKLLPIFKMLNGNAIAPLNTPPVPPKPIPSTLEDADHGN